jgi:Domain of unknown function (DUF4349)
MTDLFDEGVLRRSLHEAARGLDPTPGAAERVVVAATSHETVRDDEDADARHAAPRRRRVLVPLAAAAVVLLVTVLVLSLTSTAPPAGGPLSSHQELGLGAPSQRSINGTIDGSGTVEMGAANTSWGTLERPSKSVTTNGAGDTGSTGASGTTPAKVVAVGTVSMTVPSTRFQAVLVELNVLVGRDDGYVSSSKINAGANGNTGTATIVLRVPEHHFQSLVGVVQRLGKTTSVVTTSSDVTGEYVDYQARISALEASRTQYLAILAKATTISDILAVQSQVNDIQSQIDQLKGQRNVLVDEAAYSTLTVSLNPGQATSPAGSGLATAWHDSIGGFVKGFEWLVRALGPALFAILLLLALLVLGRFGWRATRRRML